MTDLQGRYRLQDVIGVGSFATVHRAHDLLLDDGVVVKVLAENHSLNPEVRERFIGEGRSLRRVAGPHIVRLFDLGESDRQQPYLVLEYADRGTLAQRVAALRSRGWLPGRQDVLAVAGSLAAALEAVHRGGLVHRDLSPGNVLLASRAVSLFTDDRGSAVIGADERLLVADLGMCKDLAQHSGLTVAAGTSGFRPPEQDRPGVIDARADLWAASALLLWMCESGHRDLPDALFAALQRGTATDPGERQPDVAAWWREIRAALADPGSRTPAGQQVPAADEDQAPEPVAASPRGRRWALRVTALVLAAALGLAAGLVGVPRWAGPPAQSGSASVLIEGPDRIEVGEQAEYRVTAQGVRSWVWTLPTGDHVVDEQTVVLTARTAGRAELVVRARAPDGTALQATHSLTITE